MNSIFKNYKGITLIALVITIVILIILAAVAINLTIGENGIFSRAKQAAERNRYAEAREKILIKIAEIKMKCVEDGVPCTAEVLYNGFAAEERDYYVDDILFEATSAVRDNIRTKRQDNSSSTIKNVIVSHSVAEDFKFCIDGDGEIQGVTKHSGSGDIDASSFVPPTEFEKEIGFGDNGPSSNPQSGEENNDPVEIWAQDVEFRPTDSTWKDLENQNITNVKQALDSLYSLLGSSNS